MYAAVETYCNL